MSTLLRTRISGCSRFSRPATMRSTRAPTPGVGVDHQQDQVGVLGPGPGGGDHRPVEPALGREDARRVDQQDLRVAVDRDAHQPGARGLRLGADDRDLLPDQRIDQRRLAGVGRADHRDEAAALGHCSCSSSAAAAAVSASCLLSALGGRLAEPVDRHADREASARGARRCGRPPRRSGGLRPRAGGQLLQRRLGMLRARRPWPAR